MYKTLILFIIVILISSCSLLKHTPKEAEIIIDQLQLDSIIENSINELIEGDWLSDYLILNNERPILVASKFQNETKAIVDTLRVYESINMCLIGSGQVRVVKLDEKQRQVIPSEITKGISIDYALSSKIEKQTTETTSTLSFGLSLWNDKSLEPIVTIIKEIK